MEDLTPLIHFRKSTMLSTSLTGIKFAVYTWIHREVMNPHVKTEPRMYCFTSDGKTKYLSYGEKTVIEFAVSNRYALRLGDGVGESIIEVISESKTQTVYRMDFRACLDDLKSNVESEMCVYKAYAKLERTPKSKNKVYFEDTIGKTKKEAPPVILSVDEAMIPMATLINCNSGKPFCKIYAAV